MKLIILVIFLNSPLAFSDSCPIGAHWVRAHHRRAYNKADGTFVSATEVTAHCQKNPQSFDFWRDKLKEGYPPQWPHHSEKPVKWTEEEVERILEALDEIPQELWGSSIIGIYRLNLSHDSPNPSTWGKSTIAIYDNAFSGKFPLSRYLAHELAHENYSSLPPNQSLDYRHIAGWGFRANNKGELFYEGRKSGYVEEDGRLFPKEDYANNIEYFLFEQKKLREATPAVYTWIKKHFSDKFKIRGRDNDK